MERPETLYDRVVDVTQVYLGPAADRFISRQVRNRLHKDPLKLSDTDLAGLIDWIKIAMGFLTEDRSLIEAYIKDLKALTASKRRGPKNK